MRRGVQGQSVGWTLVLGACHPHGEVPLLYFHCMALANDASRFTGRIDRIFPGEALNPSFRDFSFTIAL